MEKKKVNLHIDTSIKGPKRRDGDYLYILSFRTQAGTADTGNRKHLEETTENQAAALALEEALKRLRVPCSLTIYLECPYVASVLSNKWYEKWRYNDWMSAKGKPICDAAIWRSIQSLLNAHDIQVLLKKPHEYREWMQHELQRGEAG